MKQEKNNKKRNVKEASEGSKHSLDGDDADALIGSTELKKLKSADLYSLLKLKNFPNRTKLRNKDARFKALEGTVRRSELEAAGIDVPPGMVVECKPIHPCIVPDYIREHREIHEAINPGSGQRIDDPVGGIDVHAATLVHAIADPTGIIKEGVVANDGAGIEDLARVLHHHGVMYVAMESTAEYWLKLYWALREHGIYVLVANPRQTKDTQGKKTDPADARRIAIAFRDGRLNPSVLCTPEQFERRKINRDAIKSKQQATVHVNAFNVIFHRLDAPEWIRNLRMSERGCRILSTLTSRITYDEILDIVTHEYSRYKGKTDDPEILGQKARDLHRMFQKMAAVQGLEKRFSQHFESFMRCRQNVRDLQLEIIQGVQDDESFITNLKLLLTCPAIDVDTALTILIELVDINFFFHPKALSRWAGLAPRVNQSGYKKRSNGHIHKAGNKWLRRAVWLSAKMDHSHHKKGGHPIGDFIARLRDRGKPYKVAVTAGARHLLSIVYHVLSLQQPFQEVYAHLESETQERNRIRKLRALKKLMKEASLVDLLEISAKVLPRRCAAMIETEQEYARAIHEMLGDRLEFAVFG
jgi:transposase